MKIYLKYDLLEVWTINSIQTFACSVINFANTCVLMDKSSSVENDLFVNIQTWEAWKTCLI